MLGSPGDPQHGAPQPVVGPGLPPAPLSTGETPVPTRHPRLLPLGVPVPIPVPIPADPSPGPVDGAQVAPN